MNAGRLRGAAPSLSAHIIHFLRRFSIYRRLFFLSLILLIVTNSLVGFFTFSISAREIDRNISGSTRQVLNGLVATIDVKLGRYEALSAQVGASGQVRELLVDMQSLRQGNFTSQKSQAEYARCKRQLENLLYQFALSSDVSNLEILDDCDEFTEIDYDGNAKGASLSDPEQYRRSDEYRRAVEANGSRVWRDSSRDIGVFQYEKSKGFYISGYLTLLQSIPAFGPQSSLGVVIITVPLSAFEKTVDLRDMYDKDEVVFLAGKKGTAAILNSTYLIDRMPDAGTVGELAAEGGGTSVRKVAGASVLFVAAPVSKLDMTVVYMVGQDQLYKSIFQIRNITIAVAVACILFSLLVSYFVTSSISVPLKNLERTMGQIGPNGLQAEYRDDRGDEIGVLGEQFNGMLARIRDLLKTLVEEETIRKNEQIKRKDAELDALQMQINPHFMYNTLDLIRWNAMFEENGEGKVSKMLEEFSKFLRFNTVRADKLVTVDEELRHVQSYVAVLRFKDGFHAEITSEMEDEGILSCRIPKLTFQPIVENAVRHGIRSRGQDIRISVAARREGADLVIRIRDNGAGIPEQQLRQINDRLRRNDMSGSSIGLKNVNERIRLHFGEGYGLQLESEEGRYTSVVIRVPAAGEPPAPGSGNDPPRGGEIR